MAKTLNFHMVRYGVAEGELKFGYIHVDNVVSACMLRSGFTHKHYMTMDGPGGEDFRKHSTFRGPGSFQVKHGEGVFLMNNLVSFLMQRMVTLSFVYQWSYQT